MRTTATLLLVCAAALVVPPPTVFAGDLRADLIEKVHMYETATDRFAPVYPALAKQLVQDYGITTGVCVDVGGGTGQLAMEIAKITDLTCYSLDIDSNAVRLSGILVDEAGLTGRVVPVEGDAQNMPFKDGFADLVVSRGSIPFWPDRAQGIRDCYRILKPGGVAYIGGGFSRILDPAIRNPIAQWRADSTMSEGFKSPADLYEVAIKAGLPPDQLRQDNEPIAGWWLEIRKPADATRWYREWNATLQPWHEQIARQIVDRYGLAGKYGRVLEFGWGAGSLSIPLARLTNFTFVIAAKDASAAQVANEQAREAGFAGRIQAVACDPDHLLFDENTFDYVFGHAGPAVWAHPDKAMKEIARVLRPRGAGVVGNGCPLDCSKDSEMAFCKHAKKLREAPYAPKDGFKQCATRQTMLSWTKASGVDATIISPETIHNLWVEIRK